ncbi:MAG: Holliday junction resolvase-like protein [Methanoregula sp.]|jgi:predicted Holliday junction resolvase-like endonuclease
MDWAASPFMDLIGSGIPVLIALAIGFLLGWGYVKAQISAIEARYRAELERWKAEAGKEIRKDSVNRSRSTLKGKIAEQMAPLHPSFRYLPADARFIGSPVDYIIFDGLSEVADERGSSLTIVFMDVKYGTAALTRTQRVIKKAVEEGAVSWETLHIPDE